MKEWIIKNIDITFTTIISAIVGAVFTLLLTNISKSGRLKIYIRNWESHLTSNVSDGYGGYIEKDDVLNGNCFNYQLIIDVHNTSGKPKIMRDIKVAFYNKEKTAIELEPNNADKTQKSSQFSKYAKIGAVNIPEKSIITLSLSGSCCNSTIVKIKESTRIVLKYKNERGKTKKVTISKRGINSKK